MPNVDENAEAINSAFCRITPDYAKMILRLAGCSQSLVQGGKPKTELQDLGSRPEFKTEIQDRDPRVRAT
jgi:hypothetical protein